MTNKSKRSKPSAVQTTHHPSKKVKVVPTTVASKPATKAGVGKADIDDIFRKTKNEPKKPTPQAAPVTKKLAPKLKGNKDDLFGQQTGTVRRRTEEGYVIYSEEELGMNKEGGDTPQCPFDCTCCY